jgi:hypothetical protein
VVGRNGPARRARWSLLARLACAGLAFAGARAAWAEDAPADVPSTAPLTLVDPDAAPFSSAELTQALLARLLPADAGSPSVRVSPAGGGAVTVQVGDRRRLVALGERTGPAAARVVALVIAELASAASPAAAAPKDAAPARSPAVTVGAVAPGPASVPSVETSAPAARAAAPARVSVVAGGSKGTGSEESLAATVDVDVALPLGSRGLRLVPSAGVVYTPTRGAGTFDEVSFSAAVARLLAGETWRLLDLYAGPLLEGYSIAGANPHTGALFGAEVLARVTVPLAPRARLVVDARADAYANRVRVLFVDGGAYATPRLALALGAGFAWEWAP